MVLSVFASAIDGAKDVTATFTTAGLPERELRRALASFRRRLLALDPAARLWVAAAREHDSVFGPTAWHAHGVVRTALSKSSLDVAWRAATRGHGHGPRSIQLAPFDEERGGVPGWLDYSTRALASPDCLGSHVLAAGGLASPWDGALRMELPAWPPPSTCAWCFRPLASPKERQRFCSRLCKVQESRERRHEAKRARRRGGQGPGEAKPLDFESTERRSTDDRSSTAEAPLSAEAGAFIGSGPADAEGGTPADEHELSSSAPEASPPPLPDGAPLQDGALGPAGGGAPRAVEVLSRARDERRALALAKEEG